MFRTRIDAEHVVATFGAHHPVIVLVATLTDNISNLSADQGQRFGQVGGLGVHRHSLAAPVALSRLGTLVVVPAIRVSVVLDAPPAEVWADVEDLSSHTEWMEDAVSIDFTTEQHAGTGTEFDCATKVGPIRLVDHMEITSWVPGREMGVRHVGLITGSGQFTLRPDGVGRTQFEWTEDLIFPWWLGGPIGAMVARPVLGRIWRTNLKNLQRRF